MDQENRLSASASSSTEPERARVEAWLDAFPNWVQSGESLRRRWAAYLEQVAPLGQVDESLEPLSDPTEIFGSWANRERR